MPGAAGHAGSAPGGGGHAAEIGMPPGPGLLGLPVLHRHRLCHLQRRDSVGVGDGRAHGSVRALQQEEERGARQRRRGGDSHPRARKWRRSGQPWQWGPEQTRHAGVTRGQRDAGKSLTNRQQAADRAKEFSFLKRGFKCTFLECVNISFRLREGQDRQIRFISSNRWTQTDRQLRGSQ